MTTCLSSSMPAHLCALVVATLVTTACDVGEVDDEPLATPAGDCDASDQAGGLPAKAAAGTLA